MQPHTLASLEQYGEADALVWRNKTYSYNWLKNAVVAKIEYLKSQGILPSMTVALETDFSPNAVTLLLALLNMRAIVLPMTHVSAAHREEYLRISEVSVHLIVTIDSDEIICKKYPVQRQHLLLQALQAEGSAGIILFSSGSTGKSKAAVHNFNSLIKKFSQKRHKVRGIAFLLFDHIGGLNTLLYSLYNGGCLVIPQDRSPVAVCAAIEEFKVEALTTTPTFLNLFLLSKAYKQYNLSSLKWINYSSEVMPQNTLHQLNQLFPTIRLSQAYGLSEVGVLAAQSKSSDSQFIKLSEESCQIRIIDGLLEIKSNSSMMGYLNAPNPFTKDGWFKTEDSVEVEGEYLRILGRKSEIINVGGQKVYPSEIENVIQSMPEVEEVAIIAEPNPLTGQIIKAAVKLSSTETLIEFRRRLHEFCKDKLPAYKIPQKIVLLDQNIHSARFKKMRALVEHL